MKIQIYDELTRTTEIAGTRQAELPEAAWKWVERNVGRSAYMQMGRSDPWQGHEEEVYRVHVSGGGNSMSRYYRFTWVTDQPATQESS